MTNIPWIMIAGTGTDPLPAELETVAHQLGVALARADCGVISCGWAGVDRALGAAFVAELRATRRDPRDRFKQVLQRGRTPSVEDGESIDVEQDAEEYLVAVDRADVVILLAGRGGTYLVYKHARRANKLVLPLPATEGDARRAFGDIRDKFDRAANLGVTASEFAALDRPAGEAAEAVLRLIRQHLEAREIRDGDYLKADSVVGRDNEAAFTRLVREIQRTDMLGFIGAGASIPGGYPDWGTLIDRMRHALPSEIARTMAWVAREDDMLMRAEHYRSLLGEDYGRFIREQFDDDAGRCGPLHLDLVRLPVAHVLTTNYDTLLERAHAQAHPGELPLPTDWKNASDVESFLRAARRRGERRRYVHVHGLYNDPAHVVLTESDYQERYCRETASEALLSALFTAHAFLFVGFSFSDLDVMGVFRNTMARVRVSEPLHYAFMALDPRTHDPTLVRRRLRQKFKIDPIFYMYTPDHAGLRQLVTRLLATTTPA
ncbi:SIR2 family NAD-dependent protein deacylase [Nannocystis bainbridge]|uniref:SIR2 family protein n=1 Tax=Nannocystis bainbridge TaxID=2995303 RepID=A0ABT5E7D6_9BACT|nr:SIR2 family protein [Nannocystis bainbridge]MDC0721781.1 SIR2 family protein [Nannocystis bainbridge]